MYTPFADPGAGPPGILPQPPADPGADPPGLPLPPSSTLDAMRQQYGSANGDDPGHRPHSLTTAGGRTDATRQQLSPIATGAGQARRDHDREDRAHAAQQLSNLLLAQRVTSATPAPLLHPTTPTPTWSMPAPKTDIPPLPSAMIKALKETRQRRSS